MRKWISGVGLLFIVLLMAGVCYSAGQMRKIGGDDGPALTMVAASVHRVFASLATGDSIEAWMGVSGSVRPSRHGVLRVGDSLTVVPPNVGAEGQRSTWIVTKVVPGALLVLQRRGESLGVVVSSRHYQVEARGDSTAVISTVAAPMIEARMGRSQGRATGGAMMTFASKMMLTALRAQSKAELLRLKSHVEGQP